MPDRSRGSVWTVLTIAGGVLLLGLIARVATDAGMIWDEPLQVTYGELILDWFRSGFTDQGAMNFQNLYLYGGLFEAAAQWLAKASPLDQYDTRHVLTALTGLIGVGFTALTARRVGGPRAGFFAGVVIATTPAWVGHSLFNSKDVPFGAAAAAVMCASVYLATGPVPSRWRHVLGAGVAVGVALAVRPGGYFLFAYPAVGIIAAAIADQLSPRQTSAPTGRLVFWTNPLRLLIAVPVAWVLMLAAWPWAQLAPFTRPLEAMRIAASFPWRGEVLFAGKNVPATALPLSYLPTWFAISSPETYLVAIAIGLCALTIGRRRLEPRTVAGTLTLAFGVALPFAGALYRRPDLYDGLRHFLFVFPLAASLAGIAVSTFFASRCTPLFKWCGGIVIAAASGLVVVDLVRLHPYEYVYFNRIFGGLPAAAGRYETDYWGASYKEGLAWVVDDFPGVHPGQPTRVSSCNPNSNGRLNYYRSIWPDAGPRLEIVPEYRVADLYLAVTRYDCHKKPGEILHTVSRQGVPLLYVIRAIPNY